MSNIEIDISRIKEVIAPSFYPLLYDENRFLILRGGAGSGKSYFCMQKLLFRILYDWNAPFNHKFLCLMKTMPAARGAVFAELIKMIYEWNLIGICSINKTICQVEFLNGSIIRCMGLDDSNKLRSISGVTGIFLEELDLLDAHDFKQANLRMRGIFPTYFQIMGAFNPVSKFSWVYSMFFDDPPLLSEADDRLTTHFSTYKDNPFIDEHYKKELLSYEQMDEWYYKVYTLGEWGSLGNLIYSNKDWMMVPEFPEDITDICLGLDFGYTHPHALIMLGVSDEGVFIKELSYKKNKTTGYLVNKLLALVENPESPINTSTPIYCDSANPDKIEEIRKTGLNAIGANKGPHSVRAGIDIIKQNKLHITSDSINIFKEISKYKWKEDRAGNVFEEPVKKYDDLMDAIRYAAFMRLRKQPELGVLFASF